MDFIRVQVVVYKSCVFNRGYCISSSSYILVVRRDMIRPLIYTMELRDCLHTWSGELQNLSNSDLKPSLLIHSYQKWLGCKSFKLLKLLDRHLGSDS